MALRVFTCTDHEVHWPTGAASVVVAASEEDARVLLRAALVDRGLTGGESFTLQEISVDVPRAHVLVDGNY